MSDQYTVDNIKDRYLAMTDEITRLRVENEKLREALEDVIAAVHCTRSSIGVAIIDIEPISAARKALKENGVE